MTNIEAIEKIKNTPLMRIENEHGELKTALLMAIDALESKIHVKPTRESIGAYKSYICPSCKSHCVNDELYCAKCGQAIDWSDE